MPWGLLLGRSCGCRCAVRICVSDASRVWRCAMGIAAGQVVWVPLYRRDLRLGRVAHVACVALCHGDCWWACHVGGAVPWGLVVGVSHVWRCDVGIVTGPVAWVALCHDYCWACRVGGAVPWGLLLGVSRRWRYAMGIASGCVAWMARCLRDCYWCVAWVALCHGDCYWVCRGYGAVPYGLLLVGRVDSAMPWGLLLGGSRGRRYAVGRDA